MAKIAFLFPGQGSQKVGMGQAAFAESAAARTVFAEADAALGESLSQLCFEGPDDALKLTANTQPAILTVSVALLRALQEAAPGEKLFDCVAGHSLGEYSANVAAGTLTFADAVKLVRKRGTYMQNAVPVGVGAMAAILKADAATVVEVCNATDGVVEPVNFNGPGQIVIAGSAEAVAVASAEFGKRGARAMALPVSAPFHSSLMRPAEEKLKVDLAAIAWSEASAPIYTNVDAAAIVTGTEACSALERQVSRAVKWEQSVEQMVRDGVTLFVEVGPGQVLTGLVKRIAPEIQRVSVATPAEVPAALEAIRTVRATSV